MTKELFKISVNDLLLRGKRGLYEQEKENVQDFELSIDLYHPTEDFRKDVSLENTVDYVQIMAIVKEEFNVPFELLEDYVCRLMDRLGESFPKVVKAKIRIKKNPDVDYDFDHVAVVLERTF